MKYIEVTFHISPYTQDSSDILSALLADEGFEAFDAADETLIAWIQQQYFSTDGIDRAIEMMPFSNVSITYDVAQAPDENWNKLWEEEGFHPIVIYDEEADADPAGKALIVIHDTAHSDVPHATYDIRIRPCQSFGTGSHETTRMILRQLLSMPMQSRKVIDAGTGTGILAIFCKMLGADHVVAYDIDEWSVRNAQDNLILNGIDHGVSISLGDSSVLVNLLQSNVDSQSQSPETEKASLLIANINRNILLADLPVFAGSIAPGGELLLSGFYVTDVPMLIEAADRYGFSLEEKHQDNEWAMLLLKKGKHPQQ